MMARFGDVKRLENASVPELRRLLAPLGLVNRADRLPRLAETLRTQYAGRVPREWDDLVKLPGVGPYAAGATRSFGFRIPEGIVDANVIRFFQRFTGIVIPQGSRRNNAIPGRYWLPTARLLARTPGHKEVNYGLLDFGARICRPRRPDCAHCPFNTACRYPGGEL
jgi:A/G-specific adenine glycosylase